MASDWMIQDGMFIDVHSELRSFDDVRALLEVVEATFSLKKYFNGNNLGGRWIFQVFSREFVLDVADVANRIIAESGRTGPILEVMSGDGMLATFLRPFVDRELIATDAKSPRFRIAYPKEVETLSCLDAVDKHDPALVIACWEPFLSTDCIDIVNQQIPMIWIGEPLSCGHPDLFSGEYGTGEHITLGSPYAIGRHDSLLQDDRRTDVFLFNCDREWLK